MKRLSERERRHLIAIHECDGVGRALIRKIVESNMLDAANEASEREWLDMGARPAQAKALASGLASAVMEKRRLQRERGHMMEVTLYDSHYPKLLRECNDSALVLYYRGEIELASKPSVAIVGTRVATAYGRHAAEELARDCAREGLTVVSGMARGIDSCAHRGALGQPAGTVAVLGTSVDSPYPYENRDLHRQIGETGLILSETPPCHTVKPFMFVDRNRIIAAMTLGTVLVEAGPGSGAFTTVSRALHYGREVFVVPGPLSSPRSREAMGWYRDGAKPVLGVEDLLNEFQRELQPKTERRSRNNRQKARVEPSPELSSDEAAVYAELVDGARTIDELTEATGMAFGLLHTVLLSLTIKRLIHQEPGFVYSVL